MTHGTEEANRPQAATSLRPANILEKTTLRIEGDAGDDAELRQIAAELREAVGEFGRAMAPVAVKERHFASYVVCTSRNLTGNAALADPSPPSNTDVPVGAESPRKAIHYALYPEGSDAT